MLFRSVRPNYAYMPVYFDERVFGKSRDQVLERLKEHEIYARRYFYPAINDMTCYRELDGTPTPVAHETSLRILCLPIYEELTAAEVDHICDVILQ